MLIRTIIALVLVALAAGCSKKSRSCNAYVEMEMECGPYAADDEESKAYLKKECLKAWDDAEGYDGVAHDIKAASRCATKSPTCSDYEVCKERSGE